MCEKTAQHHKTPAGGTVYEIYFSTILFAELRKLELDKIFALLYWWFSVRLCHMMSSA